VVLRGLKFGEGETVGGEGKKGPEKVKRTNAKAAGKIGKKGKK
jgi:hypothetical protein